MSVQHKGLEFLIAGFVINLSLGVLYGWSILIVPLEEFLNIDRSTLSIVPAVGLLFFTVGVFVHDRVTQWLHPATLAFGVMLGAGFGHLTFYLAPHYFSLLFGYGVIFGLSAGVGYGLALTFARNVISVSQGWAIGSTVAAFAIGGMIVSLLATLFTVPQNLPNVFGLTSILYFLTAFLMVVLLHRSEIQSAPLTQVVEVKSIVKTLRFWRLAFAYFVMSYIGIMIVSHGAALMHERGVSGALISLTPFALNCGYVFGAILGGIAITRYPTHIIPLAFICVSITSLFTLNITLPTNIWFLAVFCIGLQFGSTVSIFAVLLTKSYGVNSSGELFGRINIGYGLAGFIAPIVTAHLYEFNGSYSLPLWIAILLGVLGLLALFCTSSVEQ